MSATYATIRRYVVGELLISFFVAFLFFFFVFFVNQLLLLAENILARRVPMFEVALLVLFSLPSILALSFPFSTLVGVMMTLGKFGSYNEILAIRAAGVPLHKIFTPILATCALFAMASFWINDYFLPVGTINFGRLYRRLVFSSPQIELEPYSVKRYDDTVLVIGSVSDSLFHDLLILDRDIDNNRRVISARSARIENRGDSAISLVLSGVTVRTSFPVHPDRQALTRAEGMVYSIPLRDVAVAYREPGPREMSTIEVLDAIREREQQVAAETLGTQVFDRTLQLYRIELHKKFALPLSCLAFMLFAFPLGIGRTKGGKTAAFGLGVLVCSVYWALLVVGQTLGMRSNFPAFLSIWTPNLLLLAGSGLLFMRGLRR